MAEQIEEKRPAIVICHTAFNDAFRSGDYSTHTPENYKNYEITNLLFRFIIEYQTELPEGNYLAFTSAKAFDSFFGKFVDESPSSGRYQMVTIVKNLLFIETNEGINKLSEDDSVFVVADILCNISPYTPVLLVSSAPSKTEKAVEFYQKTVGKNITAKDLPFNIYSPEGIVAFLQAKYPEIYQKAIERMKA